MYRREKRSWVKHLDFTVSDLLALQLAYIISYYIHTGNPFGALPYADAYYRRMAFIIILVDICIVFFFEPYRGILRRNKVQEFKAVFLHSLLVFGAILVYMWGTKQSGIYSRQVIFVFWLLSVGIAYILRCLLKIHIRHQILVGRALSKMVIVTENERAEDCVKDFTGTRYQEFEVVGVVIMDRPRGEGQIQGIPIVASGEDCMEYMRTNVVDEVFLDLGVKGDEFMSELLELGMTVHRNLIKTVELPSNRIVERYGKYVVLTECMHIATEKQMLVKRMMDIVGSLFGLLLAGIAFLIFAPIIKIQSPGPIFYSQIRIGRNGRRFKFYKFRTMVVNADELKQDLMAQNEMEGLMFKMEDDPRIFPVGKFMRKFSIDELPQFWNVLKGDMSLVGTRPPTEEEFEQYEIHHKARLGIRPGLTGMWQVSGRSDIKNFEEVVALDTEYIANWSIGLDIKILWKTVGVVLTGKGSS